MSYFHPQELKCPFCGSVLPNRELRVGKPLKCPTCSKDLQFARWQLRVHGALALVVTVAVCYMVGLRGFALAAAVILFFVPMLILLLPLFNRISKPRFEEYQRKDGYIDISER